ncbi:MAG: zinc-binding dehydrogenase [Candidatus Neomarinimicrobiota bacterium]
MNAIVLSKHGKPDVLKVTSVPDPHPASGEVRVKVHTIGLNYAETLSRRGLYGWAPKLPYVPGMEAYGEIDELGQNVTHRHVGERVIVGTQYGSYAERIVVQETQVLPAVEAFSSEENAAFAVNYLTAWISLFKMALVRESDTVLIHAAAGGVGTAAVQLSKNYGCKVYGTASSERKLELLSSLNVDGAFNYVKGDFEEELKQHTGNGGVDVVLETVGGEVFRKSVKVLRPFGRIVVAGFASFDLKKWNPVSWIRTWKDLPRASISNMARNSYGVMAFHLGYLFPNRRLLIRTWDELMAFVSKHEIRPVVGHTFQFEDMWKAHRLMESRQSMGKIVVHIS